MHNFTYKRNKLYCDDVAVADIAERFGTPLYIYSHQTIVDHYQKLNHAFRKLNPLICFSVKANSNLAVIRSLVNLGSGLDIVSGGELFRARRAGADLTKIVYASVGKTDEEIKEAIKSHILAFNVESVPELANINRIAGELKVKQRVFIRVNPDVDPKTHRFITTGKEENKFGLDIESARKIFQKNFTYLNLDISGIHIHIGSQITKGDPFVKALNKMHKFIKELKAEGINLEYLNIGGGLGIVYGKETPQSALEFSRKVSPIIKKTGLKLVLEPGRFIVGNAGILVSKVIYVKEAKNKNFIITDAAMNDLIRPALYDAHHEIVAVEKRSGAKKKKADIVGPICESGDFLAQNRSLPEFTRGDLIAVMSAGAYGFVMSSNYNSRRRVPEVLVVEGKPHLVRYRETQNDLIRGEDIPNSLLTE